MGAEPRSWEAAEAAGCLCRRPFLTELAGICEAAEWLLYEARVLSRPVNWIVLRAERSQTYNKARAPGRDGTREGSDVD